MELKQEPGQDPQQPQAEAAVAGSHAGPGPEMLPQGSDVGMGQSHAGMPGMNAFPGQGQAQLGGDLELSVGDASAAMAAALHSMGLPAGSLPMTSRNGELPPMLDPALLSQLPGMAGMFGLPNLGGPLPPGLQASHLRSVLLPPGSAPLVALGMGQARNEEAPEEAAGGDGSSGSGEEAAGGSGGGHGDRNSGGGSRRKRRISDDADPDYAPAFHGRRGGQAGDNTDSGSDADEGGVGGRGSGRRQGHNSTEAELLVRPPAGQWADGENVESYSAMLVALSKPACVGLACADMSFQPVFRVRLLQVSWGIHTLLLVH